MQRNKSQRVFGPHGDMGHVDDLTLPQVVALADLPENPSEQYLERLKLALRSKGIENACSIVCELVERETTPRKIKQLLLKASQEEAVKGLDY